MHGEQHQDPLSRAKQASVQRGWAEGGLHGSLQIHSSHRHDKVNQRFESFGLDTWKGIDPTNYHILVKPDFVAFLPSIMKYFIFITSHWISIGNMTQKRLQNLRYIILCRKHQIHVFVLKTSKIQIMHTEAFSIQKMIQTRHTEFQKCGHLPG